MTIVSFVNTTLALFTIVGQILICLAVLYLIFFRKKKYFAVDFVGKHGLWFAFFVALASVCGSLFYSQIAGFSPCELCWFQRIFMYPQVILLGLALFKKDKGIIDYTLALSFIGAVIAGYHYLLQLDVVGGLPCSAVGYSVSCVKLFVMEFGYISIPLMSLTAFTLIIIFLIFSKIRKNYGEKNYK